MNTPKYLQIESRLRDEIESGRFESGDLFYSNAELIERFGASLITVTHAVNDLVSEGLLVRYQGKGTFVSRSRRRRKVLVSEDEAFRTDAAQEETRVLRLEALRGDACSEDVLKQLRLTPEDGYYVIERVRLFEGTPFQHQVSYIPRAFIKEGVEPSYYESVYRRFREDFGLHLSRAAAHEVMRIVMPAPDEVRAALGIGSGEPCVYKDRVTELANGTVAEYIVMHKRWEYFEQVIEESAR